MILRAILTLNLIIAFAVSAPAQPKRLRIAVGGLSAESNSLYPKARVMRERPAPASREEWIREALKASTVASGVAEASKTLRLDLYPVLRAGASSLGYVEKKSFNEKLGKLVRQLKTASPPYDGVILTLHGAMVVDGYPHGDAEVVRRVREAMGKEFPIVVTHDFHANVSKEIVEYSDVLITYKENPHLDTKERGIQAATIIARMIRGEVKPVQAIAKPPMIVNIVYQDTFHEPYLSVTAESRRLEKSNPKILAVSVPGGYQWADVPAMGPSVIVVTDNDLELAEREAERLSSMLWGLRDRLVFNVPDPATAVKKAIASDAFPVVLMDTGDNIGGAFDQMVGGKTDKIHGDPVRVRGRVKALHDGQYVETEVRHGGGRYKSMGLTAVIEAEGSTRDLPNLLLLTNRPTSPNSLHQIVSNGVYPARQRILVAKGTTAPRAAYEPIAARIVEVNSGGAADVNPARFKFKHIRPHLFGVEQ